MSNLHHKNKGITLQQLYLGNKHLDVENQPIYNQCNFISNFTHFEFTKKNKNDFETQHY